MYSEKYSTNVMLKVPAVPLIPLINVWVNIYLMTSLAGSIWLKLSVWLIVGYAIYLGYGVKHSKEATRKPSEERLALAKTDD